MRWKRKIKKNPTLGETRTEIKFAYLPTKVADHWVWLEHFGEAQKYSNVSVDYGFCSDYGCGDCGKCIVQETKQQWTTEYRWLI